MPAEKKALIFGDENPQERLSQKRAIPIIMLGLNGFQKWFQNPFSNLMKRDFAPDYKII